MNAYVFLSAVIFVSMFIASSMRNWHCQNYVTEIVDERRDCSLKFLQKIKLFCWSFHMDKKLNPHTINDWTSKYGCVLFNRKEQIFASFSYILGPSNGKNTTGWAESVVCSVSGMRNENRRWNTGIASLWRGKGNPVCPQALSDNSRSWVLMFPTTKRQLVHEL